MTLGQIEGGRLASECFRNSFERDGVFSAWRLPCFFFDLVNVYLPHFSLLSFFAVEIVGLSSSHDEFFGSFLRHCPLATVRIITGVTSCAAAARIIGDHIINKIFITCVTELVRFAGLKQKRIARSNFGYAIFIADAAPARDDEIEL